MLLASGLRFGFGPIVGFILERGQAYAPVFTLPGKFNGIVFLMIPLVIAPN